MVTAVSACQRRNGTLDCRDRRGINREPAPESNGHSGIEKSMMSTVLGMVMMMPVAFGVGGYALVSRRP
jgi:hypothetical protein